MIINGSQKLQVIRNRSIDGRRCLNGLLRRVLGQREDIDGVFIDLTELSFGKNQYFPALGQPGCRRILGLAQIHKQLTFWRNQQVIIGNKQWRVDIVCLQGVFGSVVNIVLASVDEIDGLAVRKQEEATLVCPDDASVWHPVQIYGC